MVLTVEQPSSNPPVEGSQCLHPPNMPSYSGELKLREKEDEKSPPTKSLDSQWVLKWACFTSPGPEAHVNTSFLKSITLSSSLLTQQPPTPRSSEEPAPPPHHHLPHHITCQWSN